MRIHAAVAMLFATAAGLFAGEDDAGGAELLYEFRDGEAPAAAKVLEKRLQLLGIEGATVKPVEDGRRVVVRLQNRDRLEDVRTVAGWMGHVEFRRNISGAGWTGYRKCAQAFNSVLERGGDVDKARDVPPASLDDGEHAQFPNGLRWYPMADCVGTAENWILCELDDLGVTEAALDDIRLVSKPRGGYYAVDFGIKEHFREKMAKLVAVRKPVLAIIVDDGVVLQTFLDLEPDHGSIRVLIERVTRLVAAALAGPLPSKPKLVAERRIEVAVQRKEDGAELLYEFQAGEAEAAAKVLEKRLQLLGVEDVTVKPVEDGKRVVVQLASRDRLEDVQMVAERTGHLELRRAVGTDTPEHRERRLALEVALKRGDDVEKAREVPVDSLGAGERQRWPCGLRWYKNPSPTDSPWDDWLLCEIDAHGITEAALEEIRVMPSYGADGMFGIHFSIKPEFREKMAEITSAEGMRLPIIVDGEMLCAPVLHSQLTRNGEISVKGEREARILAATLGGGVLPSKPTFVAERRIER